MEIAPLNSVVDSRRKLAAVLWPGCIALALLPLTLYLMNSGDSVGGMLAFGALETVLGGIAVVLSIRYRAVLRWRALVTGVIFGLAALPGIYGVFWFVILLLYAGAVAGR